MRGRLGCTAYRLDDIIISGEEIEQHRRTHTWEKHCWTLASYFLTCLRGFGVGADDGSLLYVDADMYFYQDFEKIYDNIGRKSVGIISHRFNHNRETKTGKYNVGIIYFKDDKRGNACLKWWSDVVINDNNEWFETYGTCGDQKYLELFEGLFPGAVRVIGVEHGAPWNVQHIDGNDLVFFHFSHFAIHGGGYTTNRAGEWKPEATPWAKKLYNDYYEVIKQIKL